MAKFIPWIQEFSLRPNSIVGYMVPPDGHYNHKRNSNSLKNLTQKDYYNQTPGPPAEYYSTDTSNPDIIRIKQEYEDHLSYQDKMTLRARTNGDLSPTTTRKMMHLIDHFVSLSPWSFTYAKELEKWVKFKINFITLTLPAPQIHPDNQIKSICLQPFLNDLRKKHGVKHYIWKAELQQNGNIHFHITTNKFIHWLDVRYSWSKCIEKLGYVTRYQEKHPGQVPPSTEIRSVKNIRRFGAYLSKYISKNPNRKKDGKEICKTRRNESDENHSCIWESEEKGGIRRKAIAGRVYGASESLTKLKTYKISEGDKGYSRVCRLVMNPKVEKFEMKNAVVWRIELNQVTRGEEMSFGANIVQHYMRLGLTRPEATRLVYQSSA